jgi:hypothetical protein
MSQLTLPISDFCLAAHRTVHLHKLAIFIINVLDNLVIAHSVMFAATSLLLRFGLTRSHSV